MINKLMIKISFEFCFYFYSLQISTRSRFLLLILHLLWPLFLYLCCLSSCFSIFFRSFSLSSCMSGAHPAKGSSIGEGAKNLLTDSLGCCWYSSSMERIIVFVGSNFFWNFVLT